VNIRERAAATGERTKTRERQREASQQEPEAEVLSEYLILFGIVLGVNLLPAFGPPTWAIIVIYGLGTRLPVPAIVLTGAVAAATGRYALARAFRLLGGHVPDKVKRNLAALGGALAGRKRNAIIALGVFALSPLPSAQLFEAAGLTRLPLLPFTAAFFVGRTISYSIYALTAKTVAHSSLGTELRHSITSPVGIAIDLAMIVLLVVLARVDWEKRLGRTPDGT
jgi:uncharacterized membrane protein YdjX (TVP38/TMEM64 family)